MIDSLVRTLLNINLNLTNVIRHYNVRKNLQKNRGLLLLR